MKKKSQAGVEFLRWALPRMGYRWEGFRKPRGQVLKRIVRRMQQLNLQGGYKMYKSYLQEHPEEWELLDRLCDVTISKFFRDRMIWDHLRNRVLTEIHRHKTSGPVRVWSAGCCNGEEAYSIAILHEQMCATAANHRNLSILGTDRNAEVLERAQRGRYPPGALKELTDREIDRYFHRINDTSEQYQIDDRLKRPVTFERRDIRKSIPQGTFDLILCRNLVFTYLTKTQQNRFLERMKPHLAEKGYFVIGSNETLPLPEWLKRTTETHPVFMRKKI